MKKALLLLSLIFFALHLEADCCRGWYVGGLGGLNIANRSACCFVTTSGIEKETIYYHPGFYVGGVLGFRFSPCWRGELEAVYRNNMVRKGVVSDETYKANGEKITTISLLGNVYKDWDIGCCFSPYLGAGIGYGSTKEKFIDVGNFIAGSLILIQLACYTETNVIAQGVGGIRYPYCDYIDVSLEYRYIYKRHVNDNHSIGISVKGYF